MGVAGAVAKKTGPKPKPDGPRDTLIAIKCRKAYKQWLEALARKHRTTPSQVIDMALVKFAEFDGFDPPPER